jgi:hypothetical protein
MVTSDASGGHAGLPGLRVRRAFQDHLGRVTTAVLGVLYLYKWADPEPDSPDVPAVRA